MYSSETFVLWYHAMLLVALTSSSLQAMDRFRAHENGILVATDVAARGLDIPGVRTVIHYQLPHSADVSISSSFFV